MCIYTHTQILVLSFKKGTILNQLTALLAGIAGLRIPTSNQIAFLLHALFSLSLNLKIPKQKNVRIFLLTFASLFQERHVVYEPVLKRINIKLLSND